jgi:ABC-type multidrug transport system ATPase subunit
MRILSLYIENLKMFENENIEFSNNHTDGLNIYPGIQFTAIVGENGVGKTTLMSFIVSIFHNLERFPDRISSNFILIYEVQPKDDKKKYIVTISREEDKYIYVTIPNLFQKAFLYIDRNDQKSQYLKIPLYKKKFLQSVSQKVTYKELLKFLPAKIITSTFSVNKEYPSDRPGNYIGKKVVFNYPISEIYHYLEPKLTTALSKGILVFLKMWKQNPDKVNSLLATLGLEFKGYLQYFSSSIEWKDQAPIKININDKIDYKEFFNEVENNEKVIININFVKINYIKVGLDTMSSGEKILFFRIFTILSALEDNSVVFIEEPELHLNPSWTKQIISFFYILFNGFSSHIIIASHSYAFINTLIEKDILIIEAGDASFKKSKVIHPKIKTLLSSETEINNKIYKNYVNNNYTEKILYSELEKNNLEELEKLLQIVGESIFKFKIQQRIKYLRENSHVES